MTYICNRVIATHQLLENDVILASCLFLSKNIFFFFCNLLVSNEINTSNFQPLEVVDRGSETQPPVVENLNKLTLQDESYQWLAVD